MPLAGTPGSPQFITWKKRKGSSAADLKGKIAEIDVGIQNNSIVLKANSYNSPQVQDIFSHGEA